MDYDENDFQNQNHHIASDNNKFPPVLNPYALPKFDFDDSLQGHVRFDSLVESEDFLGIESNEDSRWLEDFPRESCGIDFSKSAADPCSISRCNNVWSEATSSESVEMLLKSVGQEETIPRQNITEVSDAFDDLGCSTKRMEPNVCHEAMFSETDDVRGLQPSFSPEDSSRLKNDIGTNQSQNEVSLQYNLGESIENNTTNLDADASGQLDLLAEGYLCDGETCNDVSGRGVSNLGDDSVKNDAEEDMTYSVAKVDDTLMDSDIIIVEDKLKSQEGPHPSNDASLNDENGSQQSSSLLGEELLALENKNDVKNENSDGEKKQNMDSDEINQQKSNIGTVESMNSHLEGAACLGSNEESMNEENTGRTVNDTDQACTYHDIPVKDASLSDQSSETVHTELPVLLEINREIDGHPVEEAVSSEQDDDSCLQKEHVEEKRKSANDQLIAGDLEGNSVASSHTMEEKVGEGDDDRGMTCHFVDMQTNTVAEDTMEISKIVVSMEESNVRDQDLQSAQAGSTETEQVNGWVDAPNPESVSVHQEDSTVLLPNSRNKDGSIGIPVVVDKGVMVPSVSKSGNDKDVIDDHKEVHKLAEVILQPMRLDIENDDEVEASKGDLAAQLSDSHVVVEEGSRSEPVEDVEEACCQSIDMAIPEFTPALEGGNLKSLCESQTAEAGVSLECNTTVEVAQNLVDVTRKGDSCAEATITLEKSGVSNPQEKCETELSGDASKALESVSVSTGSLHESQQVPDVPEDGRDHCDADQTNSGTQIANGNGSIFVSDKEIGKSEISTVQDVGVSGSEAQDGKDEPHVPDPKEIDASKAEKSSTLQIVEASPSASGQVQAGSKFQYSVKRGNLQMDNKENRSLKGNPDRKLRRPSIRPAGRESAKKGNLGKDARPVKQLEQPGKSSNVPLVPSGIYQLVQPNEILHNRQMEGPGTNPFGALATPPSSLPDLNSSAFPSMVFQQPFNDLQQMQLRAQILVYGSIISRLVPEESHMVSAFGGHDGGRSMWEKAWQTCKARVTGQTPDPVTNDAPTSSQSEDMVSDRTSKQSKVTPSPAGHSSAIGTPALSINPMIPLSSPLWSLTTPSLDVLQSRGMSRGAVMDYQSVFPQLAPNQTQPILSYVGHSTTWMSPTQFHGPWAASQTPAVNTSIRFPSFSMEPVQLTPVRESSMALSSGVKQVPPGPSAQIGVHAGATTVASPSLDLAKVTVQPCQPSSDPKSKKRKKGPTSEEESRITLESQSHSEKLFVPASVSSLKTSATATTPDCFLSKCTTLEFDALASAAPSVTPVKEADPVKEKPVLSEEVNKVKKARQQAALAAAAVSHSQELWNDVDKKRISGSISVLEAKLSSAAVAISAALAVAKAATAAANLASNAALHAKAMAGEALNAGGCSDYSTVEGNSRGDGERNSSSSIILAAKEAAKRRVEAASAAALRAENLDIIVEAAELAAKAILQAGEIVTMGDPLSLSKLAEAGPEGFWKLPQSSSDLASKLQNAITEQANNENVVAEGPPDTGAAYLNQHVPSLASKEIPRNPIEDQVSLIVGISGTVSLGDKDRMGQKLPTTTVTAPKVSESQYGLRSQNTVEQKSKKAAVAKGDNGIQEGSRVEVFKDGAWFLADVMSLENGKAYVHHNELLSIEGSGKLQEWVEIEGIEDKAPKIRIPHPMTAVQFNGSKKRHRAVIGSFTCSVGDKVDAWIRDRWWEGVVTDKSVKDGTSMTVHLPGLEETSVVKTWQLRPSLIWKDGEWVEWSSREDDRSHLRGDTPKGKRAKLGSSGKQVKGKDKAAKTVKVPDSGKPEGSKLLDLSSKEKVFDIGKSNADEGKPDSRRTIRSGLRKQGQGVVFGVPRPGKKRKFMEVSKHYVVDQSNKKAQVNNSVKTTNDLISRGAGHRGLRNAPRTDAREDKTAELKTKAPAAVKSRGLSGGTAPKKSSKFSVSAPGDASVTDRNGKRKDSSGHVGKHNLVGSGSFASSKVAIGGPISFSSRAPRDATVSKISAPKSDSVSREKPASTGGKLAKLEEDKALNGNSQVEPRRSNRQIQPTSRLLEGLQTSSIALKVPSSLHDKGHRSTRGGAKGKING